MLLKLICFILTMWYVNSKRLLTHDMYITEFYINYVVCKFVYVCNAIISSISFILTMWYVNKEVRKSLATVANGFYINYVVCKYISIWRN